MRPDHFVQVTPDYHWPNHEQCWTRGIRFELDDALNHVRL